MHKASDLWQVSLRKEAMDMLAALWRELDPDGRNRLETALLAGPPADMFAHLEPEERESTRDRRVFDRLIVLERVGAPPLTPLLAARMQALRVKYPRWAASPGERAHFGSWMEMRWGPDTRVSSDDLAALDETALVEQLKIDLDRREGLLEAWRQLVIAEPRRGLNVLLMLAAAADPGPSDVWEATLRGIRAAEHAELILDHLLEILCEVPQGLYDDSDFVGETADLLEARSRQPEFDPAEPGFWRLFDRVLDAAGGEPPEEDQRGEAVDWVSVAINHRLGKLATAFVNAVFAGRPTTGMTLGPQTERANRLMARGKPAHRHARVVGASRISYLNAIDPAWAGKTLIPGFSWSNEAEALAMWQGFSWQARVDPQLWAALKPHFMPLFTPDRLARLGSWRQNIAQALMLVGIAYGLDQFKREEVRAAVRAMPADMRIDAAEWLSTYMMADAASDQPDEEEPIEANPDTRWRERVWPWIKAIWPTDAESRDARIAEQFALAAIATEHEFPRAAVAIAPYAVSAHSYQIIVQLDRSQHPDIHPDATLALIDNFLALDQILLFEQELEAVIDRIGNAEPALRDDHRYRRWQGFLAQRAH